MKLKHLCWLLLICFLFSCKKDKAEDESYVGFLRAKVDGVAFEATTVGANVENGIAGVTGMRELMNGFTLTAFNFTGPGRYPLDAHSGLGWFSQGAGANLVQYGADPLATDGEFIITSYANEWLKGSFRFTGVGANGVRKIVSEGVFDVRIRR